ncbi:integrase catalytic domain-containing protein [Cupriavidus metallidurans]|uniref:Transposase n=1 Tax=Cupriavidus metallidurans TaxID=119219 RepID=A0A482IQN0_9BURK|nr:DDE-type integrase/transposase/recombinase [Cupriavidus metallidurans]QBP09827.1 transposase [Cupriavidus metallidurans]
MSAVLTERLVGVAQAARCAGHGQKGAIYDAACKELGLSRATLARKIKEVAVVTPRKRRSDAGQTALGRDEAMMISALLMESARKNATKQLYSVIDAVEGLRKNGMIRAEHVDPDTGEVRPLSESTINRALRGYGLHPEQLLAPAPVTQLASRHPNHVWQVDASLCVLYYLTPGEGRAQGLRIMAHDQFYKNKPRNLARIAQNRVWSYEITDHTSGWIYVEYVLGAESGENLCSILINAMQERGDADMMHGVPHILMMDPGSANTSAMTRNLCRSLGIRPIVHKPGNARVTGQVENARNIIERKLEPGLKFQPVGSLEELNALARKWRMHFNATAVHSRHGKTRSHAWMTIRADQLIKAPSIDVCRELAVAEPVCRKVTPNLRVSFSGQEFDVSTIPDVLVHEKLLITRNPWREDAAQVVLVGEDGHEVYHVVKVVPKDEYGFAVGAASIGDTFHRHADTPAQKAIKEIEQLVTGTSSAADAEAARKAKALPFGGLFDPYKHINEAELPTYLPRRGSAHDLVAPKVEFPPLSLVDAARQIKSRIEAIGVAWTSDNYQRLAQRFPNGVPADQIDSIVAELSRPAALVPTPLRAVGGM